MVITILNSNICVMTDNTFTEIQDEQDKQRTIEGNKEHPLVVSCLERYNKAVEGEKKHFEQIDRCREFMDSNLVEIAKEVGGQKLFPIVRKMSEAFTHPDGTIVPNGNIEGDNLVLVESLIRDLLKDVNGEWETEAKGLSTDGMLVFCIKPNDKGFPEPCSVDRKTIIFNENAKDIHTKKRSKQAIWSFELEIMPLDEAKESFAKLYPKEAKKVVVGSPSFHALDIKKNANHLDQEKQDKIREKGEVGVLFINCLRSPVSAKYSVNGRKVKIVKGEPFSIKIAGGNCVVLEVDSGEDYSFWWPETQNQKRRPYLPYVPFYQTRIRKGIRSPSIVSMTLTHFLKIIYYNALDDKNTDLLANPIFHGIFSGEKARAAQLTLKHELKKAKEGKKLTNIYTTRGKDLKVQWEKMSPDKIDLDVTGRKREVLEREIVDIIGILTDDTIFNKNELLGVREFREAAQRGAISYFQKSNNESFDVFNRMVLAQLMEFAPKYSGRKIEIKGGIKGFNFSKDIDEILAILTPDVLEAEWKYAHSMPTGALSAAADMDTKEMLVEGREQFPENSQIKRAYLSHLGKLVNSVNGTESFNVEDAIQEEEQRSETLSNAEGSEVQEQILANA